MRPGNCLMAFGGVLLGAYLTPGPPVYYVPAMAALSAFMACAAGNIANDLNDIESDRLNHPQRVLVRGGLSRRGAMILAAVLNLLALANAMTLGWLLAGLVAGVIVLLFLYNVRMKRIPLAGNVVIALLGGATLVTGGLAVDPARILVLPGVLVPAGLAFLLHLIREMVKDLQDIEGDANAEIKTLPQVVGVSPVLMLVLWLFGGFVVVSLFPVLMGWYGPWYAAITIGAVVIPLAIVLLRLHAKPSPPRLRFASSALKAAMVFGGLALVLA
jgi:4-hydroxybenzoate polyprenyltransferase